MTESKPRDLFAAAEAARDAAPEEAGELADLAGMIAGGRDALAELMISAGLTEGQKKALSGVRLVLAEAEAMASRLGLARAASCEAWARLVGPPASSPMASDDMLDTRPMALDEIAAVDVKD